MTMTDRASTDEIDIQEYQQLMERSNYSSSQHDITTRPTRTVADLPKISQHQISNVYLRNSSQPKLEKPIKSIYRQPSAGSLKQAVTADFKLHQTDFTSLVQLYGGSNQAEVMQDLLRSQPIGGGLALKEPLPHQSPERRAKLALLQAEEYQDKIMTRVQYLQNEERKLVHKIHQTRS